MSVTPISNSNRRGSSTYIQITINYLQINSSQQSLVFQNNNKVEPADTGMPDVEPDTMPDVEPVTMPDDIN